MTDSKRTIDLPVTPVEFLAMSAADNDQSARDANRYRWLRRFDNFGSVNTILDTEQYNTLDAAVDAAMEKRP